MKKKLLSGLGVMATTSALMAAALPASAATTDVTFSLSGGLLTVSAAPTASLGTKATGTTSVAGLLGETKVTDERGGTVDWNASALTSVFGNGTTAADAVSYNSGLVTPTGVVVAVGSGEVTLSTTTAAKVVGTTGVVGNNTATWNPTLTVTLPASSTAGNYSGTITTSVL